MFGALLYQLIDPDTLKSLYLPKEESTEEHQSMLVKLESLYIPVHKEQIQMRELSSAMAEILKNPRSSRGYVDAIWHCAKTKNYPEATKLIDLMEKRVSE